MSFLSTDYQNVRALPKTVKYKIITLENLGNSIIPKAFCNQFLLTRTWLLPNTVARSFRLSTGILK